MGTSEQNRPLQSFGDFEIVRELGRGGMGVVYEAQQKSLKRRVALKVLSSGLGLNSKAILRFRREAEAAGMLHHTNIVPIYTTGEEHGVHFYAMELIDGPSLDAVISRLRSELRLGGNSTDAREAGELPAWVKETALFDTPNTETGVRVSTNSKVGSSTEVSESSIASGSGHYDQIATMIAEVADALYYAHNHGVIHRDVKPSNLLLSSDSRLSVNDFGLARVLEAPGMTVSGELMGSPMYMSPEQITAGRVPLDHRTDIYSLGATLYELLTLRTPFSGSQRDQVLSQIVHKEPTPPREVDNRIPRDLETICLKAMEKDPDRRYQTADEFAADLQRFVSGHAISAKRIGWLGKSLKWAARNKPLVRVGGGLTVLIAVILGVWLYDSAQKHGKIVASLESEFLVHCFSHDFQEAERTLVELKSVEANSELISLLNATHKIHRSQRGDYEDAIDELEQCQNMPGYRVAGQAMLAVAYMYSGDEAEFYRRLAKLNKAEPETWSDTVYKGFAQSFGEPKEAILTLRSAESERSTSATKLMLSRALNLAALDEPEPAEALVKINEGIQLATAVSVLQPSYRARSVLMMTHLTAGRTHQEIGSFDKQREHFEMAREIADQLAASIDENASDAVFDLCICFDVLDDLPSGIAVFEEDLNHDTRLLSTYARARLALAYYRNENYESADAICGRADDLDDPKHSPIRLAKSLVTMRRCESADAASDALAAYMARYRERRGKGLELLHDYYAALLLGGADEAKTIARDLSEMEHPHPWSRVTHYMTDQISEEQVLKETEHSRRVRTYAYFAIALRAMAEKNNREDAITFLKKCRDDQYYFWWAYTISKAILDDIDAGKPWPCWTQDVPQDNL